MNSTLNNQTMSKSMNGLNIGNFDELTTESFSATTLSSTNLSVSGALTLPANSILDSYLSNNVPLKNAANTFTAINTFTQPPVMSGASIETATIPVAAINGLSTGYMDLTSNQTVTTGTKTFNVAPVVPRLGMASTANSTFVGNDIVATTAQNGTYVGYRAGRLQNASANFNTAIGAGALSSIAVSQQNTAIGYNALNLFGDGGSLANTAVGAYALTNARGGSRNLGFGTAAGGGLTFNSSDNTAICSDTISNSSTAALFSYPNITGTNISNTTPFTSFVLDPARFNISGGTPKARMSIRYYNGAGGRGAVTILTYNSATYTMTSVAAPNLGCAANSNFIFYGGTTIATSNYTGAGGTGTTFTIAAGLGTSIVAGTIFIYFTNATTTAFATVSSYNNTTGVIVLTTSITLVAGLITVEVATAERGTYVSNCVAIGSGALQNFASIQVIPMTGNCAFGRNALNGAGGGFDNSSYLTGGFNSAFGHQAGAWCTGQSEYNTFFGAFTDCLYPMSTIKRSTAIGYNAKLDLDNLIVLGTATDTTRMWAMDVRGLPNFKAGLTVSAGAINFFSNVRAVAASGDVFQAFKNSLVGNAGHVLINDLGNLLYYDSTAAISKWILDTDGKLTISNIDITGTLISKTTGTGDYIRSNSNATGFFFAKNNGDIGYADSTAGLGSRWFITAGGVARFISSSNTYKYWEFAGNLLRYYNLTGTYSITMNGDTGAITTNGTITTTGTVSTVNLNVSGTVNSAGGTTTFGGDIDTGVNNIDTNVVVCNSVNSVLGIDIQNAANGVILFSGINAPIRIGVSTTASTASANNIVIGNSGSTTGGESIAIGNNSISNSRAISIGGASQANNTESIAIGHTCLVNGQQSIGVGEGVISSSLQGVALGAEAESTNTQVIAIGYRAKGNQVNSIALGAESTAHGIQSIAIGFQSTANSQQSIAIGKQAQCGQNNSVSIGGDSQANSVQSVALGFEARANFNNSVSIGFGVQATVVNQFLLGNTTQNIFVNQTFYPYEVHPTPITGNYTLATPHYGVYIVSATVAITITLPVITDQMVGNIITLRRTTSTANISVTCSTGNTYLPFQSITPTSAGTTTLLMSGTGVTTRLIAISSTQWAVCQA